LPVTPIQQREVVKLKYNVFMNSRKNMDLPSFIKGAFVGATAGVASLIAYQYMHAILKQPRLISRAVLSKAEDFDTVEARALFIAADNLRSAIEARRMSNRKMRELLHAGYRNFRESWARDFSFASYGLLALNEFRVVKDTLEAFFDHQTPEGQFPVKLHSIGTVTRWMHSLLEREQSTDIPMRPKYLSGHGTPSLDGQCLLVITAIHYNDQVEDLEFLGMHWEALTRAISWAEKSVKDIQDGLLVQGAFADWADSIARNGRVLYTNVIYWKSIQEMAKAAERLKLADQASLYGRKAEQVAAAIQEHFWRPALGYYAASDALDQLTSSGNLLAIAWGLTSPEQANSIVDAIIITGMASPVPTKVAYPAYPLHLIAIENRLGGVANYHTDAAWLWIGAWHVIALARIGRFEEAHGILARMAEVIVRDQQVHEVYGPDGKPLSSFWYKSESPLTWNAGMVVYAYHVLEQFLKSKTGIVSAVRKDKKG
jgi:GH15 family glucan-1,4-alpha-glucosidase